MWRSNLTRVARDEDGIAMIAAIVLGAVIVLVLSTIAVRTASDLNQVRTDRLTEQALHTGDAGVDRSLALLMQNRHYNTGDTLPSGGFGSEDEERAWVLEQAEPKSPETGREGEWVVVKPRIPDADAANCPVTADTRHPACVVYSVGYTPAKDPARRMKIRMIKAEYALGPLFEPDSAILSDGKLSVKGNLQVTGTHGNAHANGDVEVSGNPSFSGSLSASGTCGLGGDDCDQYAGDDANSGSGFPPKTIPTVNPRQAYSMSEYDLCPDGTVRAGPSNSDNPPPEGTTQPCSPGAPILGDTTVVPFRGWSSTSATDSRGRLWSYSAGAHELECEGKAECDGVYYVYHGSVDIESNPGTKTVPWEVTIMAEADPTSGPEPHDHCPHAYGDIKFSGTPRMRYHPKAPFLLLVAGRDLVVTGNTQAGDFDHEGALLAHEQIRMRGTPGIFGPVIANDTCPESENILDVDKGISQTLLTSFSGNVNIHFNGGFQLPFGTEVHVPNWIEL